MQSSRRKLQYASGLSVLLLLIPAVSCKGFFVNAPTSVTVSGPSSVNTGDHPTFTALAAFSDGTTKDVTQTATWSSSNACIVAIISTSTAGANAGHANVVGTGGSVTITASYNGTTGTLTPTAPTGLTITPCPEQVRGSNTFPEVVFNRSQAVTFSVSGTSGVTWSSDNTSVLSFGSASSGVATFPGGTGQATITATANPNTGTLTVQVQ
jgi:trimeric autotransporter adhesin